VHPTVIVEHLIADTFGSHIGKYSQRLKVTQGNKVLVQAPLMHLRSVYITSRGVSISADAIEACCEAGVPILFVNNVGNCYASLYSSGLTGTVLTRRAQLLAYFNERGRAFGIAIARAKIHNQATTLKYLAKTRKDTQPAIYEELQTCAGEILDWTARLDTLPAGTIEDIRGQVLAPEGNAAQRYWSALGQLLPQRYSWTGRIGRGATDPINSLLNYGYGILYSQVEQAILLAGLDPYAGFLHADRPGKPSLVLDMVEEFRQVAVDRLVFGLANREFHIEHDEQGKLSQDTRRAVADKVLAHLDSGVRYQGKRCPLRFAIQGQARHLATFLRGEHPEYTAFRATW
jgi:CRISPR-associated protein Cas1